MRRMLAVIAVLALMAACVCAALAVRDWRTARAADAAVARLTPLPATPLSVARPAATSPSASPSASIRRLDVVWQDGEGRAYRSRITLAGTDDARVETASDGRPLVSYRASARRRGDGTLLIDATDAAVSGPAATEWVADSFTIRPDGSVVVQDGTHAPCHGYLAQDSEQRAP